MKRAHLEDIIEKLDNPEWRDAFQMWNSTRRADNTRRAYLAAWLDLLSFVRLQPTQIKKSDVARWLDNMRSQGLAESTIKQALLAVRGFYTFVATEYDRRDESGNPDPLYLFNPAAAKSLKPKVSLFGKSIFLSNEQAQALLSAIPRDTIQGKRDYALFLTYLVTGRRNSEIRTLQWGQFSDIDGHIWYKWSGKGKRDKRFELPAEVWEAITNYLESTGRLATIDRDDYIFTALTYRARHLPNVRGDWKPYSQPLSLREIGALIKKYARHADLDPALIHPHVLRHTAAMMQRQAGADVIEISKFLGHASMIMTQIYLHEMDGRKAGHWDQVGGMLGLQDATA